MLVKITLFISQIGIVASPVTSMQPLSDSDCRVISENISEMKREKRLDIQVYMLYKITFSRSADYRYNHKHGNGKKIFHDESKEDVYTNKRFD
jgi:hypothetical protein